MGSKLSVFWKVMSGLLGAVLGAMVGLVAKFVTDPVISSSGAELAWGYLPWIGGCALLFGGLSYRFPVLGEIIVSVVADT